MKEEDTDRRNQKIQTDIHEEYENDRKNKVQLIKDKIRILIFLITNDICLDRSSFILIFLPATNS